MSSAFCTTGGGPIGAHSTIYLTNTSTVPVRATMTSIGEANPHGVVPTVRRMLAVPATGTLAVDPATGLPAGTTATTFAFDGGGVVASQVVVGPKGWSTAPCASQTSAQWSFAGGSTSSGNRLILSLLNPTSTSTEVDVSFLTAGGVITPQDYQGLVVPAGQVVVENVGAYVQNAGDIATLVTAQSGTLVSFELQQVSFGSSGGLSLELGAPALSSVWRFPQSTVAAGSSVDFTLANPQNVPVTALISVALPSGSVVPRSLTLSPMSTEVFAAAGPGGLPHQVPYSLTVRSSSPIVVGRSVHAARGTPAPSWGASAGTVTVARSWVVPAPGVGHVPGVAGATVRSLGITNPGTVTAEVVVATLSGDRRVASFSLAPGTLAVLGNKQVAGLSAFTVTSSQPVAVAEDSAPSGGPGVVTSTGFPLIG
jgi:hypothetical protein